MAHGLVLLRALPQISKPQIILICVALSKINKSALCTGWGWAEKHSLEVRLGLDTITIYRNYPSIRSSRQAILIKRSIECDGSWHRGGILREPRAYLRIAVCWKTEGGAASGSDSSGSVKGLELCAYDMQSCTLFVIWGGLGKTGDSMTMRLVILSITLRHLVPKLQDIYRRRLTPAL